jgi:hypothetical protein
LAETVSSNRLQFGFCVVANAPETIEGTISVSERQENRI